MFSKFSLLLFSLLFLFAGCQREIDLVQPSSNLPPAVPVGLTVVYADDGAIALLWQSNSEPDLYGYNVYRSIDSVNFSAINFTTNNYYVDDSLDYNTTYYYRITAVNIGNKESLPSNIVSGKPVNLYSPSQPQGLSINARNWEGNISVFLSWNSNIEGDIAGFNIYRSTTSGFNSDSTNLIGFSKGIDFSDTLNLKLYTQYYYRIRAVDKGGLMSTQTPEVNDEIYGIPGIIFPQNGVQTSYFSSFTIKAINLPANYQIVVQDNAFFGTFWSASFFSSVTSDTISVNFDPYYINTGVEYYWRVVTYSQNGSQPNSVSPLYKFIIKQ